MSNEEMEIQRIKEKKLVEMMQKARAQLETAAKNDGKPILLSDASFSSEISKYPLMVVLLGSMVWPLPYGRSHHRTTSQGIRGPRRLR